MKQCYRNALILFSISASDIGVARSISKNKNYGTLNLHLVMDLISTLAKISPPTGFGSKLMNLHQDLDNIDDELHESQNWEIGTNVIEGLLSIIALSLIVYIYRKLTQVQNAQDAQNDIQFDIIHQN